MQKRKIVKIYQFDDFSIRKFANSDLDNPDQIADSYELVVKGLKLSLDFEKSLNVLPLEKGIYLIRGYNLHVLLRKDQNETAVDQFPIEHSDRYIDYLDEKEGIVYHKLYTEFNTLPYKFTPKMLQVGLIVLRVGFKYDLIDFRSGKTLISGFDNIDEKDGELFVEKAIYTTEDYSDGHTVNSFIYPSDVLVGKLNSDYEIENNELVSQKFGVSVSFTENEGALKEEYDRITMEFKDNPNYTFDCLTYQAGIENGGRK